MAFKIGSIDSIGLPVKGSIKQNEQTKTEPVVENMAEIGSGKHGGNRQWKTKPVVENKTSSKKPNSQWKLKPVVENKTTFL